MTAAGTPKFNGITAAKIEVDFLKPTVSIRCTAAFIDTNTGHTHGWTEGAGDIWSDKTMKKLAELKQALEDDLAARHFHGVAQVDPHTTDSGMAFDGLAEHLGEDYTPSI